jgi:hypothetical protein
MDRHTFMFGLQQKGLTDDWMPFQQSKYIASVLHGGESGRSRLSGGVCHALSLYVLKQWMASGINADPLWQLDSPDVAQSIVDQDDAGGDVALFLKVMADAGHACTKESYFLSYKQAIEHTTTAEFCMMALGGITKTGHAMICHGTRGAIFDPNVGYIKARSSSGYTWVFLSLFKSFYPDYLGGNKAVRVYEFA